MSPPSPTPSPSRSTLSAPSAGAPAEQASPPASPSVAAEKPTSQKPQDAKNKIKTAASQMIAPSHPKPMQRAFPVVKKKRSWKKPVGKPKRPLSAYNLFFQQERENIIALKRTKAVAKDGKIPTKFNTSVENLKGSKRKKSPAEKIGFAALAREIAEKWKKLDAKTKAPFEARAMKDKGRYEVELFKWNEEQKMKEERKQQEDLTHPTFRSTASRNDPLEKLKEANRLAAAAKTAAIGGNSGSGGNDIKEDAAMIAAAFEAGVNAVAASSSPATAALNEVTSMHHHRQQQEGGYQDQQPPPSSDHNSPSTFLLQGKNKPAPLPDNATSSTKVQLSNPPPPTHYQTERDGPLLPITSYPNVPTLPGWERRGSDANTAAVTRRISMSEESITGERQPNVDERRGGAFITGRRGGLMPNRLNSSASPNPHNKEASNAVGGSGGAPSHKSPPYLSLQRGEDIMHQSTSNRRPSRCSVTFCERASVPPNFLGEGEYENGGELLLSSSGSSRISSPTRNNSDNNCDVRRISLYSTSSDSLLPPDYNDNDKSKSQNENKTSTMSYEKIERKRCSYVPSGLDDEGEVDKEIEVNEEKECSSSNKRQKMSSFWVENKIHPALNRALLALSSSQKQSATMKQIRQVQPPSLPPISLDTLATLAGSAAPPASPPHVLSSSSVNPTDNSRTRNKTGSETIIKVLSVIGGTFHSSCHSGASKEIFNDIKQLNPRTPIEEIPFHLLITKLSTRIVELEEKSLRLEEDNIELARMLAEKRKWKQQSGHGDDENDVIQLEM